MEHPWRRRNQYRWSSLKETEVGSRSQGWMEMCLPSRLLCLSNVFVHCINALPIFKNLSKNIKNVFNVKEKQNSPYAANGTYSCFPSANQMFCLLNLMNLYLKATKENQKQGKPKVSMFQFSSRLFTCLLLHCYKRWERLGGSDG